MGSSEILDFQWDIVQRQDVGIGLVEPASSQVRHLFRHLPGVITVEPARQAYVRISFGRQRRQLVIQGLPANGLHNRVLDETSHQIRCRADGLVLSAKLAEILGAQIGDRLWVEVLEGKRPVRTVPAGRPGRGLRRVWPPTWICGH